MAKKLMDGIKFFWGVGSQEEENEGAAEDFYKDMKRADLESDDASGSEEVPRTFNSIHTAGKVLNIHSNAQMEVVLYMPKNFEESTAIVDTLKKSRPVVLNISELDKELARKIFDFCSGALYALEGNIQPVAKGIFVLAPPNIDISGAAHAKEETVETAWLRE